MTSESVHQTLAELQRLGTDTHLVEVKSAAGGLPKSIGETLSAFANGDGGTVILGLTEPGFDPAPGFRATNIRDAIAHYCSDDMEPPIRTNIQIMDLGEGAKIVMLEITPLDPMRQPSHIKRLGPYDGSFIRGGDGDRRLTAYEVTQLLSNRAQPIEDQRPITDATLADLDPRRTALLLARLADRAPRAFAGVDDAQALIRAGALVVDERGVARPTMAGLLCLGTYPQQFLPQVFVSFVALPGKEMGHSLSDGTRFLDNVTCDGPIPDMLGMVVSAARRNMNRAAMIRATGREEKFDYPVEVIRELVVNALLHRDYSPQGLGTQVQVELYPDRLVVKSPGGLYGGVIASQLGVEDVSSTRNATLAKLLADVPGPDGLPVSENRGSGLPRVMAELRRAGMSPPSFDITPGHVHVTVPQHALLDPTTVQWITSLGIAGLSDAQHIALALIHANGSVSNEMLRAWGIDAHDATGALRDLVERGVTTKRGGRRYAVYELTNLGRAHGSAGTSAAPLLPLGKSERIEMELISIVEAIRAGHATPNQIATRLGISYVTATRRVNTLVERGRIEGVGKAHSRGRTFRVLD